jgi:hypothetical protein
MADYAVCPIHALYKNRTLSGWLATKRMKQAGKKKTQAGKIVH